MIGRRAAAVAIIVLLEGAGVYYFSPMVGATAGALSPIQFCSSLPSNPVLNDSGGYIATYPNTGSWFMYNNTYQEPSVLKVGSSYYMWLTGFLNGVFGLYRATSSNGVSWSVNSTAIIPAGANGTWDYYQVPFGPSVVWNGTMYLMYYWGDNGTVQSRSIGVALSKDGIHWTEYAGNPILTPGPAYYDSGYIKDPNVIFSGGSYMMWYKGRSALVNGSTLIVGIDVATSSDGLHWTKHPGGPVVGYTNALSQQEDLIYEKPSVVKVAGGYVMAADDGAQIGYATSLDGLHWNIADGWLVRPTNDTSWSGGNVFEPALLVNGSTLLLWYLGFSPSVGQASPYKSGIGLATCPLVVFQSSVTLTTTEISTETVTSSSVQTETIGTTVTTSVEVQSSSSVPLELATISALVLATAIFALVISRRSWRHEI